MCGTTSGHEIGLLAKESQSWFVVVEFLDIGRVDDSGWQGLDARALLRRMQDASTDAARQRGIETGGTPGIEGWEIPPRYDATAHRMEWAVRASSKGSSVINHTISALGRGGVLQFSLVDPQRLASNTAAFRELVGRVAFKPGERYADRRSTDRLAPGGLFALAGGVDSITEAQPAPESRPSAGTRSGLQYAGMAVGAVALFTFVAGRRLNRRRYHHHAPVTETRSPKGSGLPATSSLDLLPKPVLASSGVSLELACAAGSGTQQVPISTMPLSPMRRVRRRRKKFDAYQFHSVLTRDLYFTYD